MNFGNLKEKQTWLSYGFVVLGLHLAGLGILSANAARYPQLVGFGFLAYTFGLRHAFDIDHIAAIDNTVRKLIQQKENPTGVGFFFSVGHSSVVFLMALVTIFSTNWAKDNMPELKAIGSVIGTSVSGAFLVIIGLLNLYLWFDIYKIFKQTRRGAFHQEQLEILLGNRGFISRFFKMFDRLIHKSWHVYPLGFLFGLGFDTASEVALMAISANVAAQSIPLGYMIALPILFAAGMSLMDTADGIFMTTAYHWAFHTPLRKIYYNLCVTGISVVSALLIGVVELVQILAPKLGLEGGIWQWILDIKLGSLGYLLVALFVLAWGISLLVWKKMKLEDDCV